jgi:hypothetical protein
MQINAESISKLLRGGDERVWSENTVMLACFTVSSPWEQRGRLVIGIFRKTKAKSYCVVF